MATNGIERILVTPGNHDDWNQLGPRFELHPLLNPELQRVPVATVVVGEEGLGLSYREAIWQVVSQLDRTSQGALRTLILVVRVDAGIDVRLHCQYGTGFRVAHVSNEVLERHSREIVGAAASSFIKGSPMPVLFLGAGFSASSNMPMGDRLRNEALKNLVGPEVSKTDVVAMAGAFQQIEAGHLSERQRKLSPDRFERTLTFEQVIRAERSRDSSLPTLRLLQERDELATKSPGPAVTHLHDLIRSGTRFAIATVNLDRLIETGLEDELEVFYSESHFGMAAAYARRYMAGDETKVPVFKLHGSIQDFDSCIVDDRQTQNGLSAGKAKLIRALHGDGEHRRHWYYVGASMRDIDLNKEFKSGQFGQRTHEHWVLPHSVSTVAEFAEDRTVVWEGATLQQRLITESADVFMMKLLESARA